MTDAGSTTRWLVHGSWIALLALTSFAAEPPKETDEFTSPIELTEGWYARIETDLGLILAKLHPEVAPQTSAHFAALANGEYEWIDAITGEPRKEPYYDGISIARVQAGRYFEIASRGADGHPTPPIFIPMEGRELGFRAPGQMGMIAYGGARYSAVTFLVTASAMPWLARNHPCFAQVVYGIDRVQTISESKTKDARPIEPMTIRLVRVFSVGDPTPLPELRPHIPQRQELTPRGGIKP